ncbi:hypothetical protein Tco_0334663 [Tanacetum coccineum]
MHLINFNNTPSSLTTVAADIHPLNIQKTPKTRNQAPTQAPTVTSTKSINQAKTQKENAQVKEDMNLSTSLVHRYKNEGRHRLVMLIRQTYILSINTILPAQHWTKDHPLEQVIGNLSQSIRTRR